MSNQMNHTNPREINEIKERLKEDSDRGGAYYCSLPSFRDSYRLVSRMLERKRSVCISDALQYHRWKGTSDGETGEIGSDGRGITKLHPTQSASGRFFLRNTVLLSI